MTWELHLGDCLTVVGRLPADSCTLLYLDPPFFTKKRHSMVTRGRDKSFSFDDLWASTAEYGDFLLARIRQFHRVLADRGSIFFHCDRTASHIARAVLDTVFGERFFRSEIIWHYRRWSNAQRGLLPQHQTVLWYSKTDAYVFNPIYEAYSPSTNVDQLLARRERDEHGKSIYARDEGGRIVPSRAKQGVPMGDVWDIPYLNPKANERVGYPTQKPILLLERIIQLASSPGDMILDPFCGSGTTLVAAKLQGRRAIGVDVSQDAIDLSRARLENPTKTESRLTLVGRNRYEEADGDALACLRGIDAIPVQRNKGMDAIVPCRDGAGNALVRVQRSHETIPEAVGALQRAAVGKEAARLIVVVTSNRPEGYRPPAGCELVMTAGAAIQAVLNTPVHVQPDPRRSLDDSNARLKQLRLLGGD